MFLRQRRLQGDGKDRERGLLEEGEIWIARFNDHTRILAASECAEAFGIGLDAAFEPLQEIQKMEFAQRDRLARSRTKYKDSESADDKFFNPKIKPSRIPRPARNTGDGKWLRSALQKQASDRHVGGFGKQPNGNVS